MKVTLEQQVAAVAREIAMRRNVYPRWVAAGKMEQAEAEHQLAAMNAVIATLKDYQAMQPKVLAISSVCLALAQRPARHLQRARRGASAFGARLVCAGARMTRWIPVAERLPDDDITVLVACKDADEPVWLGYHEEHGWTSATDGVPLDELVTHWAPLPEAPA